MMIIFFAFRNNKNDECLCFVRQLLEGVHVKLILKTATKQTSLCIINSARKTYYQVPSEGCLDSYSSKVFSGQNWRAG